jgi:hypothetical protein
MAYFGIFRHLATPQEPIKGTPGRFGAFINIIKPKEELEGSGVSPRAYSLTLKNKQIFEKIVCPLNSVQRYTIKT